MAEKELIMPKMGESIIEATILKWVKQVGDSFELDETILEIATDKVDSEVPAQEAGILTKILYNEGDVVEVGKAVALYSTEVGANNSPSNTPQSKSPDLNSSVSFSDNVIEKLEAPLNGSQSAASQPVVASSHNSNKFYSPLVLNIARSENISFTELETIAGSGKDSRVTKKDILAYVQNRNVNNTVGNTATVAAQAPPINVAQQQTIPHFANNLTATHTAPSAQVKATAPNQNVDGNVEIVEMDRMRKLIADHMVMSKHTSPHVTSFVEADVTNIVNWRSKIKDDFQKREGEKITYTPIFMQAVIKAIKDFPGVNVSLDGNNIIYKKDINIGMATALPSGNLIVPVIKNADQYNLVGLTKKVNDLAKRARANQLKPEDIQGGTYTITNVGTFGNVMGTPIINQPQVGILALGAIRKKPAVIETEEGDAIAIRQMMFMSHSYDHRVVDGFLGGSFVKRVSDYLENFDPSVSL